MPRSMFALPALLSLALIAPGAAAQACDCSCRAFAEMRSTMEALQSRAEAGERVMPPTELQQLAACAGECAMEWGQCQRSTPDAPAADAGRKNHAEGERELQAADPDAESDNDEPFALGQPRDDLERFHGVYGSDDRPGRDFFVTRARNQAIEGREIPPGYLMVGAMWGDVAPWYMKSVGDLRFEQQWTNPGAEPLVVEFVTGRDGQARGMRFVGGFLADRGEVERQGDLPEGW
ncbi:MAG: hypothetical protein GVY32_06645 [Gammaproteobacteria bacterium]|nr:hypothetical protein [Gammaproteobacteria bacterium]